MIDILVTGLHDVIKREPLRRIADPFIYRR